ncbi:MAG: hypothetical protein WAK67_07525, partial [Xanthobacteraceae bacterium]
RSTLKSNPGLSARYSRNEVAGGAPPDRGRLIAAVVAIARGKRLPAARVVGNTDMICIHHF